MQSTMIVIRFNDSFILKRIAMRQLNFNQSLIIAIAIIGIGIFVKYSFFDASNEHEDNLLEEAVIFDIGDYKSPKQVQIPTKILVEIENGTQVVTLNELKYCEKKQNKVEIYTASNSEPIVTTMTLKALKDKIRDGNFIYENLNSYIINFNYVSKVMGIRNEKNMSYYDYHIEVEKDSNKIRLPREKKTAFMEALKDYIGN